MIQVAVDIGGTFTDVVAVSDGDALLVAKVSSKPGQLEAGVADGVKQILEVSGADPSTINRFVHGTTVATNAVLERRGATVALFATAGFEDTLELGRLKRTRMYDMRVRGETPVFLAPRRRRFGIQERVDRYGKIVTPLNREDVKRAVEEAVGQGGADAIAVCYLFSFLQPEHERETREIIQRMAPDMHVSLSSEIHPVFREYERTVATTFDAYVRPAIEGYVGRLDAKLKELGLPVSVQVMQSRGAISSVGNALERPVTMLLSGPAGGVIGGKAEAEKSGYADVITFDMGGTSSDVSLVRQGKPIVTTEGRIDTFPLPVPMVDVSTVGSGGGSVAWQDDAGLLRVGPHSAGASPGPACYGKGGSDPTVTDASVLLGYLNPRWFAGGAIELDVAAAQSALARLGDSVDLGPTETALGVHRVVNARMADQMRLVSVKRGFDPREFALVLLGGAGPVHGGMVAAQLGITTLVVPRTPGVLSAYGLLAAPIEHYQMQTFAFKATEVAADDLALGLERLERRGRAMMEREGVPMKDVDVLVSADMRFVGQSYELEIPFGSPDGLAGTDEMVKRFLAAHQQVYGHASHELEVEFVNLRTVHHFAPLPVDHTSETPAGRLEDALKERRLAVFAEHPDGLEVPIFDRSMLPRAAEIPGPAIIEQADTTTVVYPTHTCSVDPVGNLIIRLPEKQPLAATGLPNGGDRDGH